jgi:hypothetical protein
MINNLSKDNFNKLLDRLNVPELVDRDFMFTMHEQLFKQASSFLLQYPQGPIQYLHPGLLIVYMIHEHLYLVSMLDDKRKERLQNDNNYKKRLIASTIDKYLSNEHLQLNEDFPFNRFYPPLTTMKMYINGMRGLIFHRKKSTSHINLLFDMTNKCCSMMTCIIELLSSGFASEALSTWRTLHETEATLIILNEHGTLVIDKYLQHLKYGLAFHRAIEDKDKSDQIFLEMKTEMKEAGLLSKDIRKFIEYGWLLEIFEPKERNAQKLNFRNGTQFLAHLEDYRKTYQMSSEITHGSPLLIYSKSQTLFIIALINLFESFFRVEKIFHDNLLTNLADKQQKSYKQLQEVYLQQLVTFHKIEQQKTK